MVEIVTSCPTNWGLDPAEAALEYIDEKMLPEFPLGRRTATRARRRA